MKQGKSLMELAQEVQRQSDAKHDYVMSTNLVQMNYDDKDYSLDFFNGELKQPKVINNCHTQVATHTGIPTRYYQKMMQETPELLLQNVNTWFGHNPTKRMIRTLDGKARAFLSDRYRILDNDEVLGIALQAMQEIPSDIRVASCEVTDRRLYLKCTIPSMEMEVKKGDPVCAGFIISNSEIGLGALSSQSFIERLICENGIIVPEYSMKRHHIGRSTGNGSEGAIEFFKDDTLAADDKALMLKLRDTITSLADEAHLTAIVNKFQETTDKKVEDPIHAVTEVQKKFQLNDKEKTSILTHLIQGGDLSQYGIMNAVTRTAQDAEDYDRATELEKMGGQIIDLDNKDWKVISEKAA